MRVADIYFYKTLLDEKSYGNILNLLNFIQNLYGCKNIAYQV